MDLLIESIDKKLGNQIIYRIIAVLILLYYAFNLISEIITIWKNKDQIIGVDYSKRKSKVVRNNVSNTVSLINYLYVMIISGFLILFKYIIKNTEHYVIVIFLFIIVVCYCIHLWYIQFNDNIISNYFERCMIFILSFTFFLLKYLFFLAISSWLAKGTLTNNSSLIDYIVSVINTIILGSFLSTPQFMFLDFVLIKLFLQQKDAVHYFNYIKIYLKDKSLLKTNYDRLIERDNFIEIESTSKEGEKIIKKIYIDMIASYELSHKRY